jgi:hypothetical protein
MCMLSREHSVEVSDFEGAPDVSYASQHECSTQRRCGSWRPPPAHRLAPVASASPPPDPSRAIAFGNDCPLRRIGTQFVRCDNLTGAGVQAPNWIPELTSKAVGNQVRDGC